jgi:hypothetical protein
MAHGEDPDRTWGTRAVAATAVVFLLVIALSGFAILGRSAPGVVSDQTGVGAGSGPQLDVHGERLSAAVFGDRFVFSLRTAAGQVSPPVLAATFPIYPGSVIVRSAAYQDLRRTLRGVTYRVSADATAVLAWYRSALEADAYRVTQGDDGSIQAVKGARLVRVQPGASVGTEALSFGVFVSGD